MKRTELVRAFAATLRPVYGASSALTYRDDVAYSYNVPVAQRFPWAYKGQLVAWVTTVQHSRTTTAHINALACALHAANYRVVWSEEAPRVREEAVKLISIEAADV